MITAPATTADLANGDLVALWGMVLRLQDRRARGPFTTFVGVLTNYDAISAEAVRRDGDPIARFIVGSVWVIYPDPYRPQWDVYGLDAKLWERLVCEASHDCGQPARDPGSRRCAQHGAPALAAAR